MSVIARQVLVGLLAGVVSGVIAGGIGARVMMRLVADSLNRLPEFTLPGTILILILGAFMGAGGAWIFVGLRRLLSGRDTRTGVVFGILLAVLMSALMLNTQATNELALSPAIGKTSFVIIAFTYGILTGVAAEWLEHALPHVENFPLKLKIAALVVAGVGVLGAFSIVTGLVEM